MSLPLSFLICLSVFNLCLATVPVEEVIKIQKVHLLGGWYERSPESKDVQKAVEHALEMFNKNPKKTKLFKMVSVQRAKSQVTKMINFKIDAILGRTKCLKTQNLDLKSCELENRQVKCHFFVTFFPVTNKHELNAKTCHKIA